MEKRQQERSLAQLLLYAPAIAFVVFFILHSISFQLHDDDLWVLEYCNSGNFVNDFNFWWHHNNGRYASAFLQLLFFRIPQPLIVISSAFFVLSLNYLAILMLIKGLIRNGFLSLQNSALFSLLGLAAIYFSSSNINDVFFWPSSVFVHGLSVSAFLFICVHLIRQDKRGLFIALIAGIFLGGASETAAVLSIFILISGTFILKANRAQTFVILITIVAGMLIHYYAPASEIRAEALSASSNLGLVKAAVSASYNLFRALLSFIILLLMLWPFQRHLNHRLFPKKSILFILPAFAALVHLLVVAVLMHDAEPARAAQAISLFLIFPVIGVLGLLKKSESDRTVIYIPATIITLYFILADFLSLPMHI